MAFKTHIARRKMLQISAAACGSTLLPSIGLANGNEFKPVIWRGIALGAPAEIKLYATDKKEAQKILHRAVAELNRLEAIFSLHQDNSALTRLNRDGEIRNPPLDLIALVSKAKGISAATKGAFDPTIQPLWTLYAEHFARNPGPGAGPSGTDISAALERVDYRALTLTANRIAFARPGMGLSLNGIAQGFITDAIADLLREEGLAHVLVDMGETRGLGSHPSGRPWRVGISAPDGNGEIIRKIDLIDRAVATSAPQGTPFNSDGRFHHLLNPRTGLCANEYRSVSVTAPSATLADALSTAFAVMEWRDIRHIVSKTPEIRVDALDASGNWLEANII